MTDYQEKQCHRIIHLAALETAGVGGCSAQIPIPDSLLIVPIQVIMIRSLAKVFDINVTEAEVKGLLAAFIASIGGRTISKYLIGWIPALGNLVNAATAAAITESIGWFAAKHFDKRSCKELKFQPDLISQRTKEINDTLKMYDEGLVEIVTQEPVKINDEKEKEREAEKFITEATRVITEATRVITSLAEEAGAKLIIYDKEGNSKRRVLSKKSVIVGRSAGPSENIDINLHLFDEDCRVSRKHAEIREIEGKCYLIDLNSSNGTYLNDERIESNKEYLLEDGNEICFGKTKTIFSS